MEPTEPENRKAQEQDSPPKTQEIEVSRGWDEHLRMYWFMDKSNLSFNRHLPDRDPTCPLTCSLRRARIWISKKNLKIQLKPKKNPKTGDARLLDA